MPEPIPHHAHAFHERPFDDMQGPFQRLPGFLGVLLDIVGDPVDQGVLQPLLDIRLAPAQILRALALLAFHGVGDLQQALGGVGAPVQHHVLDPLPQVLGDVLVDRELAGVDDRHVQAGLDGVVQEDRVNGLAHRIVAPERERHVGKSA